MTLEEAIDQSITKILELNPDLTYAEVYELCSDYLLKFNKPTKEETKIKSLKKYLSKFFETNIIMLICTRCTFTGYSLLCVNR